MANEKNNMTALLIILVLAVIIVFAVIYFMRTTEVENDIPERIQFPDTDEVSLPEARNS